MTEAGSRDVRRIRGGLGLTQVNFSRLLHVHPISVSRWENGKASPDAWQRSVLEGLEHAAKTLNQRELDKAADILDKHGGVAALGFLLGYLARDIMAGRVERDDDGKRRNGKG